MDEQAPIPMQWTGDSFVPISPFWARRVDRQFVVGERYQVEVRQERSISSHNHEFAWVAEAWRQLPEAVADLYPSPEHLRKRALIEAGYYNEDVIDAGSHAAALRVAAYIRGKDDFAVVIVRRSIVMARSAKSQSRRAMNKLEFQASKEAIMEIIASLIGVTAGKLTKNAGVAA